jgi:hypothetical protein
MIEMLLVGAIVLVATLYATWALIPAPARQSLARRLLVLSEAPGCPDWIGRRIRAAAKSSVTSGGPCDGCSSLPPLEDASPRRTDRPGRAGPP